MSSHAARSSTSHLGLLIARLVLGAIFLLHGYQKVVQWGFPAVTESFAGMGAPMPEITGPVVAVLELVGGALMILGLLTRVAGVLLAIDMVGAVVLVHARNGVFVDAGGWELVGALGAGALALAAAGPGRFALDALGGGSRRRRSAARSSATAEA